MIVRKPSLRLAVGGFTLTLLALALPSLAPGSPAGPTTSNLVVSWQSPTPPEGQRYSANPGTQLQIGLAASATGGPAVTVEIGGPAARPGAGLQAREGNPATATYTWTPTAAQAGSHQLTFSARIKGVEATTIRRTVTLVVPRSPPKARPRPTPRGPQRFKLSGRNHVYRWAKLRRPTIARARPTARSRAITRLGLWTPENTPNLVMMLEGIRYPGGVEWIKVRLATLPNNTTGWVRRSSLGRFRMVRTRLVIHRSLFRATLYRAGKPIFRARIGVGQSHWPTPRGEYFIRNELCCYNNAVYGPFAFGLSARSAVLTDWPGGGFIGIHGTNAPSLIPGRISHGCIRMRNGDITRLVRLVSVGTPVSIQ